MTVDGALEEDHEKVGAEKTGAEKTGAEKTGAKTTSAKTTSTKKTGAKRIKADKRKARSLAEQITLAICSVTLATVVGLVLYDWQLSKNLPPAFQIKITETVRLTEGRYYLPFTLRNTGGRIVRTVQVVADLQLPDGNEETGEQQFDFLSGNERKKGSFVFEHNPKEGTLIVRVASFRLP